MRIPNIPVGKVLNEEGYLSDEFKTFFYELIKTMQENLGDEGLVSPTQTASNLTIIQNNVLPNGAYSCKFGTTLYDSTNNTGRFAIDNGSGAPIFKTFVLA
jgi:hypothetical protein